MIFFHMTNQVIILKNEIYYLLKKHQSIDLMDWETSQQLISPQYIRCLYS